MTRTRPSFPGTHRVQCSLAGGRFAIYWYGWRGGPLLCRFEGANLRECERAEIEGAEQLAAAFATRNRRPEPEVLRLCDLVERYKSAPDGFLRLEASTKVQWIRWLDEITLVFGQLELVGLSASGIRARFIKWRNTRASTPRSADYGMQVLKRLLAFGVENELIVRNPTEGIEGIYRASRADIVVEDGELEAILANVTPEAGRLIRLAAATGLRRGDLIALKWSDISEHSIEFGTSKSRRKNRPIVPIFEETRKVIEECRTARETLIAEGRVPTAHLLTTRQHSPWKADSATQAFWRAAKALNIDKNLHDLRGTAVTRYILAGLTDEEVGEMVGWEPKRVLQVRRRYVDRNQIAKGIIARIEKADAGR